jgi:isopropylmalate/homocitrate/citramalate synthase
MRNSGICFQFFRLSCYGVVFYFRYFRSFNSVRHLYFCCSNQQNTLLSILIFHAHNDYDFDIMNVMEALSRCVWFACYCNGMGNAGTHHIEITVAVINDFMPGSKLA